LNMTFLRNFKLSLERILVIGGTLPKFIASTKKKKKKFQLEKIFFFTFRFMIKEAPWAAKPLRNRTDFPPWMKNITLWLNTGWEDWVLNCSEGKKKKI
jgi:hypothetical protein